MGEILRIERLGLGASNAWLIHAPAGMVLVDAGSPWSARAILACVNAYPAERLRLLYITHAHVDHYGAAAQVRSKTGAEIVVHAADANSLALGESRIGMVRDWGWSRSALPAVERSLRVLPAPADRVVVDGEALDLGGVEASVLHAPGHTPGSSVLLVRGGANGGLLAFAGDLLSGSGRLHVQSSYAVNWQQVAESVRRLLALRPEVVYPGHGRRAIPGRELESLRLSGPAARAG